MSNFETTTATMVGMVDRLPNLPTLSERVSWILKTGRVPSARGWGIAADISDGYVGRIKNEGKVPSLDVIEALAKAARVPVAWLRGDSTEPDRWVEKDISDPAKRAILVMAREKGEDPAVIRMLEDEEHQTPQGMKHWRRRLRYYRSVVEEEYSEHPPDLNVLPDDDTFGVDEG